MWLIGNAGGFTEELRAAISIGWAFAADFFAMSARLARGCCTTVVVGNALNEARAFAESSGWVVGAGNDARGAVRA